MTRISRSLDVALAVLVLALAVAVPALAGGEECAHGTKASHAEKIAHMKDAGWSGFEADDSDRGYVVTKVRPNSPAAEAGIQKGDVLVAYQGIELAAENHKKLKKAKKHRGAGSEVTYTFERDGRTRQVALTLTEVPDAVLAEWRAEMEEEDRVASID